MGTRIFYPRFNFSTGSYAAYLPEGDYYVEAWGFDPETGTLLTDPRFPDLKLCNR